MGYKELPLELRAQGEYEPRYRVPLDALGGGEMPVLPISVYGAVAALRGGDGGNDSSPGGFFFFLYDRRTSGLGGLSFDEGQFSVFGRAAPRATTPPCSSPVDDQPPKQVCRQLMAMCCVA